MIINYKRYLFFTVLLLVFIVLPANNYFPNASQVISAIGNLISDYSLISNLLFTISIIFISLFVAFILTSVIFPSLRAKKENSGVRIILSKLGTLFPPFLLGVYLIMLSPTSYYINFLFGIIVGLSLQFLFMMNAASKIPKHFSETVSTFNINREKGTLQFLRSSALPLSFSFMKKLNRILWIHLLVFEFIKNYGSGMGTIVRLAFEYWNVPMLFAASIIITATIYVTDFTLIFLARRFFVEDMEELFK